MASTATFGDRNSGLQAGVIHGPVHVESHHHPLDRPETPPSPSSTVPFRRDNDFVHRKILLDRIHHKCAVLGSWTALVGLGGVGKSQLAIEYAYRSRERSPQTWVFWVHASNAARFEQSYRDIADFVRIPQRRNFRADIFKLVHDWLRGSKEPWIIILDNVDDARFLLEAHPRHPDLASKQLREYLPQSQNGSILITTRSREAALKLVELGDIIDVQVMDEADALALFRKKMGAQEDDNDMAELAKALEFMPLAIVQAAAYITERAPRCSIRQYLEQFQKSDRKRISLLDHEGGQLRRDRDAKNSIIITWHISFEYIRCTRPSAAELISLMSFFDRQRIPQELIQSWGEREGSQRDQKEGDNDEWDSGGDEDEASGSGQKEEFEKDLMALRNFSFISVNVDGKSFEMHRLVQLATRKWLEAHEQLEKWKQHFIRKLCEEFPTGEYENWVKCQELFPHAKSAAAQRPEGQNALRDWASILYKAAWYALERGNGAEAEKMSVQALKARRKIFNREDEDILQSMAMVGLVYKHRGRWDDAKELEVQVMETRKKKLGVDHPNTLTSIANLASTYWNQGRWEAAEELEVQVMETLKKKLGVDHPDTLTSIANLASTYRNQGRWEAAEELEVQVMETRKKKLGVDHPDTLTSIANLASTYRNQGRWEAAEELDVQVMETRKKKLGVDHPDTLTSIANLASTYRNQGRWEAAEELDVQVMETLKKKLGVDHPNTLTSMANLASTYWNQGRWEAAEELEVQVMETRKKKLGVNHPDTLTSMNNLAFTWKGQGRDKEAISLMRDCVRLRQRIIGASHPHFISSSNSLTRWEAELSDISDSGQGLS